MTESDIMETIIGALEVGEADVERHAANGPTERATVRTPEATFEVTVEEVLT